MDKYTLVGGHTILECRFNLEGEGLYSVKWYKDGREFYRYVPLDNPKMQAFTINGIHVKVIFFGLNKMQAIFSSCIVICR